MTRCRVCPVEIIWCVTPKGKTMPVDAVTHPEGNVRVTVREHGAPLAEVLGPLERAAETDLHMPHHATCVNWKSKRS